VVEGGPLVAAIAHTWGTFPPGSCVFGQADHSTSNTTDVPSIGEPRWFSFPDVLKAGKVMGQSKGEPRRATSYYGATGRVFFGKESFADEATPLSGEQVRRVGS